MTIQSQIFRKMVKKWAKQSQIDYKEYPQIISGLKNSLRDFIKETPVKNGLVGYLVQSQSGGLATATSRFPSYPKKDLLEMGVVIDDRNFMQKVLGFIDDINGVETNDLVRMPLREYSKIHKGFVKGPLGLEYFNKHGLNIYLSDINDFYSYKELKTNIQPIIEQNLKPWANQFKINYLKSNRNEF